MADLRFPGIPAIAHSIPKEIRSVLAPMREFLQSIAAGNLPKEAVVSILNEAKLTDSKGNPVATSDTTAAAYAAKTTRPSIRLAQSFAQTVVSITVAATGQPTRIMASASLLDPQGTGVTMAITRNGTTVYGPVLCKQTQFAACLVEQDLAPGNYVYALITHTSSATVDVSECSLIGF